MSRIDPEPARAAPEPTTAAPDRSWFAGRREPLAFMLPSAFGILLLAVFLFGLILPRIQATVQESRLENARELTLAAAHVLDHLNQRAAAGELSLAEAQRQARQLIGAVRYGSGEVDYFWINDLEPTMIMHPYRPDLEGRDLSGIEDAAGNRIFVQFAETAQRQGEGFVSYHWQWHERSELVGPKISHVRLFAPWGWVIGTGVYLEDIEQEVTAVSRQVILLSGLGLGMVFLLSGYLSRQGMRHAERRRLLELELRRHQGQLENLVAVRTGELRQALTALAENEERFRMFVDFTHDWEYWVSPAGGHLLASPACERVTGYSPEDFSQDPQLLFSLVHPEDRELFARHVEEHLPRGGPAVELEFRIVNRQGKERWIGHVCQPVYSQDGRYLGRRASNRDITRRKKAEQQMELFLRLVDQSSDYFLAVDLRSRRITMVNEKLCRDLQYSREELLGLRPEDISTRPAASLEGQFQKLREAGRSLAEDCYRRKDGAVFPVEVNMGHTWIDHQEFAVAAVRDITERRRLEQELQKAQRLESIGLLAGGIAHDFNNILTAIQGNIELARTFLPQAGRAQERLSIAQAATLRARGITRQLLTFAQGGAPIRKPTSMPPLLRESVELVLRGSRVKGCFALPPGLWLADVDETQMNQVLNNLVINAVQAMPGGGVLRVEAGNEELGGRNPFDLPAGKYLRIDITDEGIGIPAEDLDKIFDLYFTTKEEGSGLGLAISYSIIKRHGGAIAVRSKPGEGSTFSLLLPASGEIEPEAPAEEGRDFQPGSGRILLMDDEETITLIAADMLAHLGYEVDVVRDGLQAIAAYQEAFTAGRPYAAVIMDLIVPAGMGGREAVSRLLELDPEAKVIASSGYANDPVLVNHAAFGFRGVIPKPYNLAELATALRQVVGGGSAPRDQDGQPSDSTGRQIP